MNVWGTFSDGTCPCEPSRQGERDTREYRTAMFSGGWPDIFQISRSTALRLPQNILSRKHGCLVLSKLFASFFHPLFLSLYLSLLSFVRLSTCSHLLSPLRFWFYFISIRYRLLRISHSFIGYCLSLNFTLYFPHASNGLTQYRSALIHNAITINRPF